MAYIYDNYQSIIAHLADAPNGQRSNGWSPADSDEEPEYSSDSAGKLHQTNREELSKVLQSVLQPLTYEQNPSAESGYCNVVYADGNFRYRIPILTAWLADCPKSSNLYHLEHHVCSWCECPKKELGDYVPPEIQHSQWDHDIYRTISDANTKIADAELSSRHVH